MRGRLRASAEAGFTLIELLIAMLLIGIFMAFVVQAIVDGFRGTNKSVVTQKTDVMINTTLSKLEADLRSARAEHRNFDQIRDPVSLQRYIQDGIRPRGPTGALLTRLDDISAATPTRVSFYADVDSSAGFECITYYAQRTGAYWGLYRRVGFNYNCSTQSILQPVIPPQETDLSRVFTYQLVRMTPGCPQDAWVNSVGTVQDRHRIMSIRFDVGTKVAREDASSEASGYGLVNFRTRQNDDYRIALGCEAF